MGSYQQHQRPQGENHNVSMVDEPLDEDNGSSLTDEDDNSSVQSDGEPDILKPCTYSLGLSRFYVPGWTCQDAFREFYQNWKDAIIASFDLNPRSFKPVLKETPNQIRITMHRQHVSRKGKDSQELLGYVLFKKKEGSVELTNFKAELSLHNLRIGGTTKSGQNQFAGIHGEGFKLAALVMRRHEHAVKFGASSFYWNFRFRKAATSNFVCRISSPKPGTLQGNKEKFTKEVDAGVRRGFTSNIWEDVSVKISKSNKDGSGKVSEADFRSWLDITIDINGPQSADIVETDHGDLILDQNFFGRIYLKGLRVPGHGPDGREYNYGYNLIHGQINRDRERLVNPREEAKMLAMVWECSIIGRGDDITDKYIDLFRNYEKCPDIVLAEEKVSKITAKAIWNRLRTSSPDAFFYPEGDDSGSDTAAQTNIITTDLKKKPEKLPKALWNILNRASLARTPQEERIHLFANSELIEINEDPFCISILRGLKASLSLHQRMGDIMVHFVEGSGTEIDLLFRMQGKLLQVHEKWIDFQRIHQVASCDVSRLTGERPVEMAAFFCDHLLVDLFELALNDIRGPLKLDQSEYVDLRRRARERIQQMPRLIRVSRTGRPNQLEVSWTGNESGIISEKYGPDIRYQVILHKMSTCGSKNNELLHRADTEPTTNSHGNSSYPTEQTNARCGCARQVASRSDPKATFSELNHMEHYFPMVARIEDESFFGVPPAPLAPDAASEHSAVTPAPTINPVASGAPPSPPEVQDDDVDDMFPVDSAGDAGADDESEDRTRQTPPRPTIVSANTTRRASRARSSQRRPESPNIEIGNPLACHQDEKTWQKWHEQELPEVFSRFIPKRETRCLQTMSEVSNLECPHLGYEFQKDEYARIRMKSEGSLEYVVLIRDIRYDGLGSDAESYYLLTTKYSFLRFALHQVQQPSSGHEVTISDKELLLHFEAFNKMGDEDDAEVLRLIDISHAESLTQRPDITTNGVGPTVRAPPDQYPGLFCRFAIRSATDRDGPCFTPLRSGLVPRECWKLRNFVYPPKPLVYDLTPNVLGPSEGFSQAGYEIRAGFGFDQAQHLTWKIRHNPSQVYDGSPQDVFDDFASGKLQALSVPAPEVSKIALVAGENTCFSLSDGNKQMPSTKEFLKSLDIVDAAVTSPLHPDFQVMVMSPALLHSSTIGRFSKTILNLLEQRLSVHIKLSPLQDHGIPQDRSSLIVVASPFCKALSWHSDWPLTGPRSLVKIKDVLGDLAFENPRTTQTAECGFLCSAPRQYNADLEREDRSNKYVYNHQTGRSAPPGEMPVDMNATALSVSCNSSKSLVHPNRRDILTVRECARLQGFPNDFVFYQSETLQYKDVLKALPPIVGQMIAKTILHAIRGSEKKTLDYPRQGSRAYKRPRVEDEGESA